MGKTNTFIDSSPSILGGNFMNPFLSILGRKQFFINNFVKMGLYLLTVFMKFLFSCTSDKSTDVQLINPFQLKAHVASDEFKNSTPQYPEKKKELEKLANSLSENDNPVLMLMKLTK
ncbi:MAG: hypothetical protein AB2L24_07745 [Mangrovibacterium sp.]